MSTANNHTDLTALTFKNDQGETLSLRCEVDNMLASHQRAVLSVQLPDGQLTHLTREGAVKFITFNDEKWVLID